MSDFKMGEKAVYPAHGVAEVIGIEKKEINTTVCSFYVLKVIATGSTMSGSLAKIIISKNGCSS